MTPQQELDYYKYFLTDAGTNWIVNQIAEAKAKYGAKWLAEFKRDYPILKDVIDLAANHPPETAFMTLQGIAAAKIDSMPNKTILETLAKEGARLYLPDFFERHKTEVFRLHATLRAEIDKPRF